MMAYNHIGRKHKEIPECDGEFQMERDANGLQEKNSNDSINIFKVYKDVLDNVK